MTWDLVRRALADWFDELGRRRLARHRLRTPDCPPLGRLAQAAAVGWRDDELRHIRDCAYCQLVLTFEWRAECPPVAELIRWIAGESPFAASLAKHAASCPRCARLADSRTLRSPAVGLLGAPLVWQVGLAAPAAVFAQTPRRPFQCRLEDEATGMVVTLVERDRGVLAAHLETAADDVAGRRYRLEVVGARLSLHGEVTLAARPEGGGATGRLDLSTDEALWEALGGSLVVLVSPVE